jgi:hypothetical protein
MSADPISSAPVGGGLPQPAAIRSQLPPELAAIFDSEWAIVLEEAKQTQGLEGIHDLLLKWRHTVAAEAAEPGWYFRLQERAASILERGTPDPDCISGDEVRALIAARLRDATPGD